MATTRHSEKDGANYYKIACILQSQKENITKIQSTKFAEIKQHFLGQKPIMSFRLHFHFKTNYLINN